MTEKINLLVIGGGGREHAIVWKLAQSPRAGKIYCSPGNGGIADLADLIPSCAENDWSSYAAFVKSKNIALTIVGPEQPLCSGIVDHFTQNNLRIFGPNKSCAQLEGSKAFSKNFMKKHGIPTAEFAAFDDFQAASRFLDSAPFKTPGFVVKADGLAAGKGVSVCDTPSEAKSAAEKMLVQKVFRKAGAKIVIEEKLPGRELSLMALCDGKSLKLLPPARDYKRVNDQDQGPNTGGMGAIAPVTVPAETMSQIKEKVADRFLAGLRSDGMDYRGVIYFGLMLASDGPKVLEFNVRFGDPETQVVLPLIRSDLISLFDAVIDGRLAQEPLEIEPSNCVGVVCASGGYPEKFDSDKEIQGLSKTQNGAVTVFHAGTRAQSGRYFSAGGRVLAVVGKADSVTEARRKAYGSVFKIEFENMHYRNDIAKE